MDLFLIKITNAKNISQELLNQFKHKNFRNYNKQVQHSLSYLMVDRILKEVYGIKNRELIFEN